MVWFSAMLEFVVHIEDTGAERYARTLIVFQSSDNFSLARDIALKIGKSKEQSYRNGEDKLVQWKLKNIETLDLLGEQIENQREIYSEFQDIPSDESAVDLSDLHPELSKPTQTGV